MLVRRADVRGASWPAAAADATAAAAATAAFAAGIWPAGSASGSVPQTPPGTTADPCFRPDMAPRLDGPPRFGIAAGCCCCCCCCGELEAVAPIGGEPVPHLAGAPRLAEFIKLLASEGASVAIVGNADEELALATRNSVVAPFSVKYTFALRLLSKAPTWRAGPSTLEVRRALPPTCPPPLAPEDAPFAEEPAKLAGSFPCWVNTIALPVPTGLCSHSSHPLEADKKRAGPMRGAVAYIVVGPVPDGIADCITPVCDLVGDSARGDAGDIIDPTRLPGMVIGPTPDDGIGKLLTRCCR